MKYFYCEVEVYDIKIQVPQTCTLIKYFYLLFTIVSQRRCTLKIANLTSWSNLKNKETTVVLSHTHR